MKKIILIILLILPLALVSHYGSSLVWAEDSEVEEDTEKIEDLEDKIEKYEEKIEDLQNEANTLSREIDTANAQINVTQLKIANSIEKIRRTEREIDDLVGDIGQMIERIEQLSERIEYQEEILNERIRERYKTRETSPMMVLLGSTTLNNLVKKAVYLKVMEVQDNKVLTQMRDTKNVYNRQKKLYEDQKEKEEELQEQLIIEKANLDAYKIQLENKKAEKARLLEMTQNDEEKYQKMLADARRELEQITGAVAVLKGQGAVEVEKGDKIGVQGNTGYSFGDHLHFGVYRYSSFEEIEGWDWYYNNYVDPSKVLESKTVYWDDGCSSSGNRKVGKGDWDWPLKNPTVSQGFGYTCWSNYYYGGKVHPAYDMYDDYGASVYAVEDGDAYFCDNCLGDGANGVFIFHDDDYMTIYWHLQ